MLDVQEVAVFRLAVLLCGLFDHRGNPNGILLHFLDEYKAFAPTKDKNAHVDRVVAAGAMPSAVVVADKALVKSVDFVLMLAVQVLDDSSCDCASPEKLAEAVMALKSTTMQKKQRVGCTLGGRNTLFGGGMLLKLIIFLKMIQHGLDSADIVFTRVLQSAGTVPLLCADALPSDDTGSGDDAYQGDIFAAFRVIGMTSSEFFGASSESPYDFCVRHHSVISPLLTALGMSEATTTAVFASYHIALTSDDTLAIHRSHRGKFAFRYIAVSCSVRHYSAVV